MKKLRYSEAELLSMLDATTIPPDDPINQVMEYIKENDLTPELCQQRARLAAPVPSGGRVFAVRFTLRSLLSSEKTLDRIYKIFRGLTCQS